MSQFDVDQRCHLVITGRFGVGIGDKIDYFDHCRDIRLQRHFVGQFTSVASGPKTINTLDLSETTYGSIGSVPALRCQGKRRCRLDLAHQI